MTRCLQAFGIIVGLSAMMSAPASASEVTITLTGEVETVCNVSSAQSSAVVIDFGTLFDTEAGQQTQEIASELTLLCNDPDGGTLTIESDNGGELWREGTGGGDANAVGYTIAAGGANGLAIEPTDLAGPVSRTFLGSPDLLGGQQIVLRFRANGVRQAAPAGNNAVSTTVYSGVYRDIVRVNVTAN